MIKKEIFAVTGMTCAACVAHVERAAKTVLGEEIPFTVSLLSSALTVTVEENADIDALFRQLSTALRRAGYGLEKKGEKDADRRAAHEKKIEAARLAASVAITALLMLIAMWHMIPHAPKWPLFSGEKTPVAHWCAQAVLTAAVLVLERRFFRSGFSALFHRSPNMDSLVALGSASAAVYGLVAGGCIIYGAATANSHLIHVYLHQLYLESAAMILTLVSVGKFLEGRARHKTAGAVRALIAEEAPTARLLTEQGEIEILLEELTVGAHILVRAGEKIPADGIILKGEGSVNEAMITGESLPRSVFEGERVTGATVLAEGSLTVRVDRIGEESTLRRIAALLEETASTKSPAARLADKVSGVFVPIVLCIAALTAVVWLIIAAANPQIEPSIAFQTAVSVLVISCPCALGLATPTAITVGSGRGAKFGILFKSAEALETLATAKYLLTDKTGTLTKGEMTVTDTLLLQGEENEMLDLLASIEALSAHPVAKPMAALSKNRLPLFDFISHTGKGLCATDEKGNRILAGRRALYESIQDAPSLSADILTRVLELEAEGKSVTLLAKGPDVLGIVAVADTLRADSVTAVSGFEKAGVRVVMLTGDNPAAAEKIAAEAGIKEYKAELLPEDKERIVADYAAKATVAMVGDGINDAPALARADVGLAIGAGTAVAVESAGVVLTGSALTEALAALELGRATRRNIKQNLLWALLYNVICIPIAAGVFYSIGLLLVPMIASLAMSFSSIFVVLNALRLSYYEPPSLREKIRAGKNIEKRKYLEEKKMFAKKNLITTVLTVNGMMCNHCTAHVEKALTAIKGVASAKADLASHTVTVEATAKITLDQLKKAIVEAGYTVA
ncbi:MAG: heavy metal translocating P-type ATPase [Ruminococcaceae bacterium]|nr:heavy metal translocating P-type ATPase [Oscillospiraceae bacterium]